MSIVSASDKQLIIVFSLNPFLNMYVSDKIMENAAPPLTCFIIDQLKSLHNSGLVTAG